MSFRVDFVDVSLSKVSGIKVVGVLDKFLFGLLDFELIEFEVVAGVMFAPFKSVMLSDFAMEVSL